MCGGCLSVCLQEQGVGVCLSAGPGCARAGLPAGERREPLCFPGVAPGEAPTAIGP